MTKQSNYTKTDKVITTLTTWIAAFMAVALLIWGIITLYRLEIYEETDDAQVEAYINPITARVSGFITEIRYQENQDVKKGDTLLIIDNREYSLEQQVSVTDLQHIKEQLRVLKSNIMTASKLSEVSRMQIPAARSKLVRQQQEFERYTKLLQQESITLQQMENVQSALDVAKAEYQSAIFDYEASLSKITDSKAQIAPLISEMKRRELVGKLKELEVSYTVVRAPYDGRMGRRTIQLGQQIQVGQTLAFIVDKDSGIWVVANFKETQIQHMTIGQTVEIVADIYPAKKISGQILSFSPATGARFSLLPPDNSTGNFVKIAQRIPVKIRIDASDPSLSFLTAGMNASVTIRKNI